LPLTYEMEGLIFSTNTTDSTFLESIRMNDSVYIVGAGSFANSIAKVLIANNIKLAGIIDNNTEKKLQDYTPIPFDSLPDIRNNEPHLFIIAISIPQYSDNAYNLLIRSAIPESSIVYIPPEKVSNLNQILYMGFMDHIWDKSLHMQTLFDEALNAINDREKEFRSFLIEKNLIDGQSGLLLPNNISSRQGLPERHLFMQGLIQSAQSTSCLHLLEIGSWCGESLAVWCNAITQSGCESAIIYCVDIWSSYFNEGDLNDQNYADSYRLMDSAAKTKNAFHTFLHNANLCESSKIKIITIKGASRDILPTLKSELFDIIYIDASHYYSDVSFDIEESKRLVKDRGIICGDDLELELCNEIEELCLENKDRDAILQPGTDIIFHPGVTLAVSNAFQNVSNYNGFWAIQKESNNYKPHHLGEFAYIDPIHLEFDYMSRYKNCYTKHISDNKDLTSDLPN